MKLAGKLVAYCTLGLIATFFVKYEGASGY